MWCHCLGDVWFANSGLCPHKQVFDAHSLLSLDSHIFGCPQEIHDPQVQTEILISRLSIQFRGHRVQKYTRSWTTATSSLHKDKLKEPHIFQRYVHIQDQILISVLCIHVHRLTSLIQQSHRFPKTRLHTHMSTNQHRVKKLPGQVRRSLKSSPEVLQVKSGHLQYLQMLIKLRDSHSKLQNQAHR